MGRATSLRHAPCGLSSSIVCAALPLNNGNLWEAISPSHTDATLWCHRVACLLPALLIHTRTYTFTCLFSDLYIKTLRYLSYYMFEGTQGLVIYCSPSFLPFLPPQGLDLPPSAGSLSAPPDYATPLTIQTSPAPPSTPSTDTASEAGTPYHSPQVRTDKGLQIDAMLYKFEFYKYIHSGVWVIVLKSGLGPSTGNCTEVQFQVRTWIFFKYEYSHFAMYLKSKYKYVIVLKYKYFM